MFKRPGRNSTSDRQRYDSGRRRLRRLRRDPAAHALVSSVAEVRGVSLQDLLRTTRSNEAVANARCLAMYLVHVQLARPLTDVGFLFFRDRTTVAHACKLIEDSRDLVETEAEIASIAAALGTRRTRRGRRLYHVI